MQITLPDDQLLKEQALRAGFASVEEYLLKLIERDVQSSPREEQMTDADHQTSEEWIQDFDAWLKTLKSHNPNFDASRESIYPVR